MIDTVSGYFLALVAHSTMIFTIFFNQDDYLLSALPFSSDTITEYLRVQFNVVLVLTIVFCILEFLFILRALPSVSLAMFSVVLHTLACLFILKFIIDIHPSNHFLILFLCTSVPPVVVHIGLILFSLRLGKACLQ
ncbi:tmem-107 [Pristionchus pacificus]|uniref:Transmembrane protein 107 n=1 Tax=Pristionchus pacificus TaxID=54126 RepID=A0A2A6BNN3_PRIPA|nr:tmem-107 [Pristionchus pacificus]|eukprot:PDM67530.1 hypothetical protein PRIPAC_48947 [Pristionchus pacificus]